MIETPSSLRISTLNLRHGGGQRASSICDYLSSTDDDIIVLTEFRMNRSGRSILDRMTRVGYRHAVSPLPDDRRNGVCVMSRLPFDVIGDPAGTDAFRIVTVRCANIVISGVYFAGSQAKRTLFEYLLHRAPSYREPFMIIGDMNTGLHRVDEDGATFHCVEEFRRLSADVLKDLYRVAHEDRREYSWYSNSGNGFRLDHALANEQVVHRLQSIEYDHGTRDGLTDHSALRLSVSASIARERVISTPTYYKTGQKILPGMV